MIEAITAHERVEAESARQRARDALGDGRHPVAGGATEGLSAPVLRRHAPAGGDRHRPAAPPGADYRRRADHGAGRHHPGADPVRGAASGARAGHGDDLDHPRSQRRRRPRRPGLCDVCRPGGGERQRRRRHRPLPASLHPWPDRLGAVAQSARPAAGPDPRHGTDLPATCRPAAHSAHAARMRRRTVVPSRRMSSPGPAAPCAASIRSPWRRRRDRPDH